jgi:hypothetical protein
MLGGPYPYGMAGPDVADRGDGLWIWMIATITLNKQSRIAEKK